MVLPEALQARVTRLSRRLHKFMNSTTLNEEEDGDKIEKKFLKIFRDICVLVREQTASQSPHLPEPLEAVQKITDEGIEYACGESDVFDFMPSWAHDNDAGQPLIEDAGEAKLPLPANAVRELLRMLQVASSSRDIADMTPDPWKDTMKQHPKSSPLARPRPKIPALTPTAGNVVAMSVYDARCEIRSQRISTPIKLCLSRGTACLALSAAGGWKNRSPALYYYLLDAGEATTQSRFPTRHFLEPSLAVTSHLALDEVRRLIFVGDDDRVKSYAWTSPNGENCERKPLPTHTLDCPRVSGPITVLPNGAIVRAGKGQAAVWDISTLEAHGENGKGTIGGEDGDIFEDTMRDDPERIEVSSGSPPTSYVQFADLPDLSVTGWEPLVQAPLTMLCHSDNFDCVTIDLEHQGRLSARYIGHGGAVTDLSVSGADPQVFLTACEDGFARLFDVRTPLPVLTLDACQLNEPCDSAVLAHPDAVFTGTGRAEQIKMWDVRARTPVYELATGNNRVESLAWDSTRNCLYAATECSYQDRMGYRHDYRRFKRRPADNDDDDEDGEEDDEDGYDDEDEDDEDEDEDDDPRAWPKNAWHDENYFGYAFDAGNHRIYRYVFKEDPDVSILPKYGDADMNESPPFW